MGRPVTTGAALKFDLPFLSEDVDRHGNARIYFRRPGQRKIRLRAKPGSDAFLEEYRAAAQGLTKPAGRPSRETAAKPGSLRYYCQRYYQSAEFKAKAPKTRRRHRAWLDGLCDQRKEGGQPRGDDPAAMIEKRHIRAWRDRLADKPNVADSFLRAVRGLFKWAEDAGELLTDPAATVRYLKPATDGHHTWTPDEFRAFLQHHKPGSKARLALALLAFTGVRRSDVVRLGRQMMADGWLRIPETKGQDRKVKVTEIPVLPELQAAIDATPSGNMTFLVTEYGRPFTAAGFGNWFRRQCDQAGLPQCSAHGVRKLGASTAAENGATENQLKAMFGWVTSQQPTLYTRKANRKKMAADAMRLIAPRVDEARTDCPTLPADAVGGTKSHR